MKKIVSVWLCLLLFAALPFGALAEGLEIEYDDIADAAILAVEDAPETDEEDILSEAVELAVPEEEETLLPGDEEDAACADFVGEAAVSAVGDVAIDEATFPDKKFRKHVKDEYDKNGDGTLSEEERAAVTEMSLYSYSGITDLTGIKLFPNLASMYFNNLSVSSLDVSGCTALKDLSCYGDKLTSLDVSGCTALEVLTFWETKLTSLDVSSCTALKELTCYDSEITHLDLSKNAALESLGCTRNLKLASLDLSGCTSLTVMELKNNPLTSLDVSGCTALRELILWNNDLLTGLDVSRNTALERLECIENKKLASLKVKGCASLRVLDCYGNQQLTSMDVSGSTILRELYVDNHKQLTSLNLSGCTGIEKMNCSNNKLISVDLSSCTALTELACCDNPIISLDLSRNTRLEKLDCFNNDRLTSLDLSKNTALKELMCCNNKQLTALDISRNTKLERLNCSGIRLTSLDVSNYAGLSDLECANNQLTSLDVSNNPKLSKLDCSNNKLTVLDISNNNRLEKLNCANNRLTRLNIGKRGEPFYYLSCQGNRLAFIDISKCNKALRREFEYRPKPNKIKDGVARFTFTVFYGFDEEEEYELLIDPTTAVVLNGEAVYGALPSLADAEVAVQDMTWTGKALKPEVTVTFNGVTLENGTDYKVAYENNVAPGTATVTVTGKKYYTDSKQATFTIAPADLSAATVTVKNPSYTWNGAALTPLPTVLLGEKKLKAERDYTVSYKDNVALGTATVTVTGKGNYTGSQTATFTVTPRPMESCKIAWIASQTYTGKAIKPAPEVTYKGETLKAGTDYTVSYKNNKAAGTATVTVKGMGVYAGTKERTFTIKALSIARCDFSALKDATSTGKAIAPKPTVKFGGKKLKAGTDYAVSCENNKAVGKATVTITGKGNFNGTKKLSFKILPKGIALTSLTADVGKLEAKWDEGAGIDGYQLQYGQKKDFSDAVSATVKGAKAVSKVIRKLESGKTYYVRIRTYKAVNGKKYFSDWSKALSKKVK